MEEYVRECKMRDRSVHLEDWRTLHICRKLTCNFAVAVNQVPAAAAECPSGLVHSDCFHHQCEPSCSSLRDEAACPPLTNGICFPGCFCPAGLVRDGSKCVPPQKCRNCKISS